jgi:signal transduction histidine kinase
MTRVKQVRVYIEDLLRHKAIDGAMQQLAVSVVEFGDEFERHMERVNVSPRLDQQKFLVSSRCQSLGSLVE